MRAGWVGRRTLVKGGDVEVKIPNKVKIIWWLLLVGFFIYLFTQRYDFIMKGATTSTDIVIFLILIVLLVIPLFQEFSLFGVSFKKEIDTLRNDIEKQIISLKTEIRNTVNIYPYGIPPPDTELPALKKMVDEAVSKAVKTKGVETAVKFKEELTVADDTQFLFAVRYAIENELRRIFNVRWESLVKQGYLTIPQMLRELFDLRKIDPQIHDAIREVNAICSAAIHGKTVSEKAINFVRDVAPGLVASLRAVETISWTKQQKRK
jgi:hypothetical protein